MTDIFSKNFNNYALIATTASTLKSIKSFDELSYYIEKIRNMRIVEDFDNVVANNEMVSLDNVSYFISEALSYIVYGHIDYDYTRNYNDFAYLFQSGRLLLVYCNTFFNIEKQEMLRDPDLEKTYNKMVLMNII